MSIPFHTLHALLSEEFPDATIVLTDLAGDDDHYHAEIISKKFQGLSRVRQHQLVYASLKGGMREDLHALSLKTGVPEQ